MAVQNCTSSSGGKSLNHLGRVYILRIFKMKFALLLLLALVVISQEFYIHQPYPRTFWMSPFMYEHDINNYPPLVFIKHKDLSPSFLPTEGGDHTDGDQNEFPDIQSRVRGFTSNQLSSPTNEKARFLVNGFGGYGGFGQNQNSYFTIANRYFKTLLTVLTTINTSLSTLTATQVSTLTSMSTSTTISTSITSTTSTSTVLATTAQVLTLVSVVSCVPAFEVAPGAGPCGRRRRKRQIDDYEQFAITPSETFKLTTTVLPSMDVEQTTLPDLVLPANDDTKNVNSLASSKDETHLDDQDNLREKRFFKNYPISTSIVTSLTISSTTFTSTSISTSTLIVPTTSVTVSTSTLTSFTTISISTFTFVNQTITQTVNLINPPPIAQCVAPNCVACLPAGIIVCAANAG